MWRRGGWKIHPSTSTYEFYTVHVRQISLYCLCSGLCSLRSAHVEMTWWRYCITYSRLSQSLVLLYVFFYSFAIPSQPHCHSRLLHSSIVKLIMLRVLFTFFSLHMATRVMPSYYKPYIFITAKNLIDTWKMEVILSRGWFKVEW